LTEKTRPDFETCVLQKAIDPPTDFILLGFDIWRTGRLLQAFERNMALFSSK
jgi:hypothetical protein